MVAHGGAASEELHDDALAVFVDQELAPSVIDALEALAGTAVERGAFLEAVRLASSAARQRDEIGYVLRFPFEQRLLDADLAAARAVLGDEAYAAAQAEGRVLDAAGVVEYVRRMRGERTRAAVTGWDSLTRTETEVATRAARGMTNREIAAELLMGAETVKTHLGRVYAKLGLRSRTELAAAYAAGSA